MGIQLFSGPVPIWHGFFSIAPQAAFGEIVGIESGYGGITPENHALFFTGIFGGPIYVDVWEGDPEPTRDDREWEDSVQFRLLWSGDEEFFLTTFNGPPCAPVLLRRNTLYNVEYLVRGFRAGKGDLREEMDFDAEACRVVFRPFL
ncbi:MAG: hypothetical protein ACK5MT_20010 [Actinomycetales bacterium]